MEHSDDELLKNLDFLFLSITIRQRELKVEEELSWVTLHDWNMATMN